MSDRTILTLGTEDTSIPLLHMSSSPLPSAGMEYVFQGCGEGSNTPPPSPPPSPNLDTHLQAVFSSCDPGITGLVPAGKLVEYLTSLVDQEDMEGWKVEELYSMLDPAGANMCVDLQLFLRVGRDWVERLATQEKRQHIEEKDDEEKFTDEEKVCEDKYLKQQLSRMREEYSELLHLNEEQVARLTKDLDHSKEKIVSLEKDLEKSCDMLEEIESMKQKCEKLKEMNDCLKLKEDEIIAANVHLNAELLEEKCNLAKVQLVVKELREGVSNAQSALAFKELEMKEILSELEEMKRNLKNELFKNEELEYDLCLVREKLDLSESAGVSKNVNDGVSQLSSKVQVDEDFTVDDGVILQPRHEFSSHPVPINCPVKNSGQETIMEEIQEAVDMDTLPSLMYRKHFWYADAETEVRERKERLFEAIKTKIGVENDIWLVSMEKEIEDCFNSLLAVNNGPLERITLTEKIKKTFLWIILTFIFLLICFTFFGGFEIDYQIYYPVTWQLLRRLVGSYLPGPALLFRYNTMPLIMA